MKNIFKSILLVLLVVFAINIKAQHEKKEKAEGYKFTVVKENKCTPAKNQNRAGTCWSYSTLGFIEAEMLRLGKPETDLSEMFVVHKTYADKAKKYVRMHGTINFGGGGAVNDAIDVIRNYGIVPEEAYKGLNYGEDNHVHGELDDLTKSYVDAVIKNSNQHLSTAWFNGFEGILNAYLGVIPEKFNYNSKEYTPKTFAKEVVGINPDDYIYLTSFTHHSFYKPFIFEVQDNWSWNSYLNLPIDELQQVIESAINNGYTIGWAADVSEKGFSYKNGVAIVPVDDFKEIAGMERDKWDKMSKKDKEALIYNFDKPGKEKVISQEIRQKEFDNYLTTDDHGMLITGIAKDQNGSKYYKVKNSWGTDNNDYNGFFFASESFVRFKTINIVVHKNAIPKEILTKLGL